MKAGGQIDARQAMAPPPPPGTPHPLSVAALAALTVLLLYLCWRLAAPFVNAFAWAFTLAVICAPLRKWFFTRLPRLAATLLMVTLVVVAIAVPITFVLRQLLQESLKAETLLRNSMQAGRWREALAANRWLGSLWIWADQELDLSQFAQQAAAGIAQWIAPAVARSVGVISQTGVALLALFFFLRDADDILPAVSRILPLTSEETRRVFVLVSATIRTAVYGRVFIGFLQGSLGGVIFAIVGLPAPVFWGAIMSVFAMLPFLGAFVIWIPACVFLVLSGHWIAALVVAIWGIAVINPVDNILYPILVGSRVGMHPLVLFVAFVGGLIVFGPTGLILGPCIVAATLGLLEVWQTRQTAAGSGNGGA